jgi:phage terminase small subunit
VKLNIKQKAFADYFIETGNAYQSAIKAGYSENYAKGNVIKLLENESVKSYIDERMKEIASNRIAKAEEVMEYLTRVLRDEETEPVVVMKNIGDFMTEPEIVEKKLNAKDRIKAAELLGKRYSLFTDKVDLQTNVGVTIIDDIGMDEDA